MNNGKQAQKLPIAFAGCMESMGKHHQMRQHHNGMELAPAVPMCLESAMPVSVGPIVAISHGSVCMSGCQHD